MYKAVLITGASSGIGRELARVFAENGNNIVLTARDEKRLSELKDELETQYGVAVWYIARDLSDENAVSEIYEYTLEQELQIDILINNAGFGDFGDFASCDIEKQIKMTAVNILAVLRLTRIFLPSMIECGCGSIMNTASLAAFEPGPFFSVYYATKAFVLSFSEALCVELKKTGVNVTALCPGSTVTGFEKAADAQTSGLFKNFYLTSARYVADYAYKALKRKKAVAICALPNKITAFMTRLLPRRLVRELVGFLQK